MSSGPSHVNTAVDQSTLFRSPVMWAMTAPISAGTYEPDLENISSSPHAPPKRQRTPKRRFKRRLNVWLNVCSCLGQDTYMYTDQRVF